MSTKNAPDERAVAEDRSNDSELTFEKPGPGTWELEKSHFTDPFSRWMQEVFPPAAQEGFSESFAAYGALVDGMAVETVNGFPYMSIQPAVGSPEASGPPPKLLFMLLTKIHPTMRRRVSRMEETFEIKRWRKDVEKWDTEWKPERIETNRSLQAVDPADLTDEELVEHLEDCRREFENAVVLHHRMDLCPLFPMGDFLAHATDWTDRSPGELLGLFEGASPMSAGATDELQRLATAIEAESDARERLFSGDDPGEIVDDLRARSDEVGAAMEAWLDLVGYRIVGYDVADFYALEKPSVLVRTLRAALDGSSGSIEGDAGIVEDAPDEALESIREEVPPEHRETFDELYGEARYTYRIRDERTLHDLWTAGLTRRALLEAGRRLAERGHLHDPEHVVDLGPDEVLAVLQEGTGPSPDDVAARVEYRRTHDADDAPDRLGPAESEGPPPEWLPEPSARGMRAVETMIEHLTEAGDVDSEGETVRGLAASAGTYEGTVRRVSGPGDFERIQDGDVLVTETTSPTFNVVLPLLGAVVTDQGGVLSHAAIVAREYEIPCVVGCEDATERLDDGDRVVVDGEDGAVRLLSRGSSDAG
jgi:pyruvate,water dikinase